MLLPAAFVLLSITTTIFLIRLGFKATAGMKKNRLNARKKLVFGLLFWQLFILVVGSLSFIQSYEFPPLFAVLFIIPSFLFTALFLFRNRNRKWINSIPQDWIIYFQSFRILVELLFIWSCDLGIFNPEVTFLGYNYDLLFALTAPITAYLVYQKQMVPLKFVQIWNYLGLVVLASVIFLFLASLYLPEIFGETAPILPLKAMTYPYVLIAAFLMPAAVFLHLLSIVQIRKS